MDDFLDAALMEFGNGWWTTREAVERLDVSVLPSKAWENVVKWGDVTAAAVSVGTHLAKHRVGPAYVVDREGSSKTARRWRVRMKESHLERLLEELI